MHSYIGIAMIRMEIKANLNHLHIAPRKVRLVAGLIKGMDIDRARVELRHRGRRASPLLLKLLQSAAANAVHNFQLDEDGLFIKDIAVNPGPVLKRMRPRAFGRGASIRKRTSHVALVLESKSDQARFARYLTHIWIKEVMLYQHPSDSTKLSDEMVGVLSQAEAIFSKYF